MTKEKKKQVPKQRQHFIGNGMEEIKVVKFRKRQQTCIISKDYE